MTTPAKLPTKEYAALHQFLADRIADLGPRAMADPFVAGVNAQLVIHGDLLRYRDHGAIDVRDAGFIDGIGLALRHVAARWDTHPGFQPHWAPPRVEVEQLLEFGDRYRATAHPDS
ncbi:hypothetical protein [Streptomyces javensis]|uniref:Uncharacterized protein n=1 Tax=Streptomyces javensis TaxID=114698 RepID=A0ABS0R2V8_9ACTN|nr:hypothetical protein [Streptomyces javensis]MBI0311625.1 hypothetical protein [Streptomyces javensis]